MDETAFPILLVDLAYREKVLKQEDLKRYWPMVQRAAGFLVRNGPVTAQDRWEEDPGVNAITLAIAIAALVEGSKFLGEEARRFALLLADNWNARLEDWTYVQGTVLARRLGVSGYYIRTAPVDALVHEGAQSEHILIKNRACDPDLPADEQLSTDFLQLVRFGLRQADDPHIRDSLKAVDQLLTRPRPAAGESQTDAPRWRNARRGVGVSKGRVHRAEAGARRRPRLQPLSRA